MAHFLESKRENSRFEDDEIQRGISRNDQKVWRETFRREARSIAMRLRNRIDRGALEVLVAGIVSGDL